MRAGDALIAHGDRLAAQPFLGRQLAVTAAEGLGEHLGIPRGVTAGVAEVAQSPTVSRMAGRLMHRMGEPNRRNRVVWLRSGLPAIDAHGSPTSADARSSPVNPSKASRVEVARTRPSSRNSINS